VGSQQDIHLQSRLDISLHQRFSFAIDLPTRSFFDADSRRGQSIRADSNALSEREQRAAVKRAARCREESSALP